MGQIGSSSSQCVLIAEALKHANDIPDRMDRIKVSATLNDLLIKCQQPRGQTSTFIQVTKPEVYFMSLFRIRFHTLGEEKNGLQEAIVYL